MGGMNQNKRDFLQDLFPVNSSAGKLRALLTLLTIFILWTFNAQNQADPASYIFDRSAGSGLIESVLGELALRYFNPSVLIMTFTPFILLFFAHRQTAAFLSAALVINPRQMQRYLMRCAFSIHKIKAKTDGTDRIALDEQGDILLKLGGPAQVQVAPGDFLLIETISSGTFHLALCRDTAQPCICDLDHLQRMAGLLHESNLRFAIQTPTLSEPIGFTLAFPRFMPTEKEGSAAYLSISPHDARFLLSLIQPQSPVQHLLDAEACRFFQKRSQVEQEQMLDNPIQPPILLPARKAAHNSYAQHVQLFKRARKSLFRLHRRSCYCSFFGSKTTSLIPPAQVNPSQVGLLKELKLHLQREMVSFFKLSTIHITIMK